jgi:hypothetical protein
MINYYRSSVRSCRNEYFIAIKECNDSRNQDEDE